MTNPLIAPMREAILQRGCTDRAVEDALKIASKEPSCTPDESDLVDWILELYELPYPVRRAIMELSYSMRAEGINPMESITGKL